MHHCCLYCTKCYTAVLSLRLLLAGYRTLVFIASWQYFDQLSGIVYFMSQNDYWWFQLFFFDSYWWVIVIYDMERLLVLCCISHSYHVNREVINTFPARKSFKNTIFPDTESKMLQMLWYCFPLAGPGMYISCLWYAECCWMFLCMFHAKLDIYI